MSCCQRLHLCTFFCYTLSLKVCLCTPLKTSALADVLCCRMQHNICARPHEIPVLPWSTERGESMWNRLITPESAHDMTGEPQSLFKTGPRPQTVQRKHNPLSTAPDDTQNTAHVQRARVTARDNVTLKQIAMRGGLQEWKRETKCWKRATYTLVRILFTCSLISNVFLNDKKLTPFLGSFWWLSRLYWLELTEIWPSQAGFQTPFVNKLLLWTGSF